MKARAYCNWGRWVADCPHPDCTSAELAEPRQPFYCKNCHTIADVEWPDDAAGITRVLSLRPVPGTQNWFPTDHPLAVARGIEHGQTVDELQAENEAHGVAPVAG